MKLHMICTIKHWLLKVCFQNAMGSKMKSMISDVDHGDRVTALESEITGLEDTMDQHSNSLHSRMVKLSQIKYQLPI